MSYCRHDAWSRYALIVTGKLLVLQSNFVSPWYGVYHMFVQVCSLETLSASSVRHARFIIPLRCALLVCCNWVRTDFSQFPSDLFVTIFTGLCVDKQPNNNSILTVMLLLTFLPNPVFYVLWHLRHNHFVTHCYRHSILVAQNEKRQESSWKRNGSLICFLERGKQLFDLIRPECLAKKWMSLIA